MGVCCQPTHSSFFFCLALDVFPTSLHTRLGFSHPLVLGVSHCICSQLLDPKGIHFFCYVHGGEKIALHDIVLDAFMVIAKDVGFHVL
jgi:hypothetical protein